MATTYGDTNEWMKQVAKLAIRYVELKRDADVSNERHSSWQAREAFRDLERLVDSGDRKVILAMTMGHA